MMANFYMKMHDTFNSIANYFWEKYVEQIKKPKKKNG